MREDFEKFNLENDLENLRADLDRLSVDLAYVLHKSAARRLENEMSRRPFSRLLLAFGAGFISCALLKFFGSRGH